MGESTRGQLWWWNRCSTWEGESIDGRSPQTFIISSTVRGNRCWREDGRAERLQRRSSRSTDVVKADQKWSISSFIYRKSNWQQGWIWVPELLQNTELTASLKEFGPLQFNLQFQLRLRGRWDTFGSLRIWITGSDSRSASEGSISVLKRRVYEWNVLREQNWSSLQTWIFS